MCLIVAFFCGAIVFNKCLCQMKKCQINNFAGGGDATIQLNIPIISKIYKSICCFWISWMSLEYYIGMQGFHKFHQFPFLCYHQELACTPKDPLRQSTNRYTKNNSKYIQDIQRYTKIYKIPSGGWAVPPGPAPAPVPGRPRGGPSQPSLRDFRLNYIEIIESTVI